jgi:hypothetical protein
MTGMKLGVLVLGMAVLAGVSEVQKSVDNLFCHDSRALYIMAQYKIAVGDTKSALELVRKAKNSQTTCSEKAMASETAASKLCPYNRRG